MQYYTNPPNIYIIIAILQRRNENSTGRLRSNILKNLKIWNDILIPTSLIFYVNLYQWEL